MRVSTHYNSAGGEIDMLPLILIVKVSGGVDLRSFASLPSEFVGPISLNVHDFVRLVAAFERRFKVSN
ncbi:hypothetical protein TcWFU_004621 [Taenia crassiceps]|uniref:Uncharacterized protein n=1 Tax=Taenia crassiceps TaxID=6207 RepID=A0ABR4QKU3_9CEST